jgi:outer membrane protein, heavy metal efflux system
MKKTFFFIAISLWAISASFAQMDTLRLTFDSAKVRLLRENLQILSSYYEISLAEADLVQSKLWRNPYLVWNQDMYSTTRNDYMNYKNQFLIQVEQVFSISGKHLWNVRMAKLGIRQNRLQLQDVLRGLLYEFGEKYWSLDALEKKQSLYIQTVEKYDRLIESFENRLKVGATSVNEVLRLKSERLAVISDVMHNKNELIETMANLRQLMNLKENVFLIIEDKTLSGFNDEFKPAQLIDEALTIRPDAELANLQIEYQETNLKLQRANAVPDVKLAYQPSDKGSNYVRPYQGMVFETSLPLFDRNQGNIKRAKLQIKQATAQQLQIENKVSNEVIAAFSQWLNIREGFKNFTPAFMQSITELSQNADQNYDKKNINILQYIDLQRIYIQNQSQFIDLQLYYAQSINRLNFTVGKEVLGF